jgi:uncharacterized protein with NRDE domain
MVSLWPVRAAGVEWFGRSRRAVAFLVVCLLIALFQVVPSAPLIVAANRDERYDRPAVAITTLREAQPRVLGGRDEVAGGTWLAVNEFGVVAGLTNVPSPQGRDTTKRSRGELPVALAAHQDAAAAVAWICATVDPSDYNPCWLLVGDRESLFYVDLTGGRRPVASPLPAGSYVLENAPLLPRSAKAAHVAGLMAAAGAGREAVGGAGAAGAASVGEVREGLATVLRDHSLMPGSTMPGGLSAACVHADRYGTRSAMIVTVGTTGPPQVQVADGPSCQVPLVDAGKLWRRSCPPQ